TAERPRPAPVQAARRFLSRHDPPAHEALVPGVEDGSVAPTGHPAPASRPARARPYAEHLASLHVGKQAQSLSRNCAFSNYVLRQGTEIVDVESLNQMESDPMRGICAGRRTLLFKLGAPCGQAPAQIE